MNTFLLLAMLASSPTKVTLESTIPIDAGQVSVSVSSARRQEFVKQITKSVNSAQSKTSVKVDVGFMFSRTRVDSPAMDACVVLIRVPGRPVIAMLFIYSDGEWGGVDEFS